MQEFRAITVTYTRNSITAAGVSLTVGEPGLGLNYSRPCPCYLWIYLRSESIIISSTATDECHIRINMNELVKYERLQIIQAGKSFCTFYVCKQTYLKAPLWMELWVWVILEQSNWNIYCIYDRTITSKRTQIWSRTLKQRHKWFLLFVICSHALPLQRW